LLHINNLSNEYLGKDMTTNRRPLIAGNWKMYKTVPEAVAAAEKLKSLVADAVNADIMIAPTFTALASVATVIANSNIVLGAQNLFWEKEGAYTGEISADMLVSAGCKMAIIGHSERRQYFHETDNTVNRKIRAALDAHLVPILCIGETEAQREANQTFLVLDKQVQKGLEEFSSEDLKTLIIAYEPVWAIGTGKTATSAQAQEVHAYLRKWIAEKLGQALANSIRILYGGSVKPNNVNELMSRPDIDGALVGGASLDPDTFKQLVLFNS
jgi:triosephosphate isomerase